MTERDCKRLWEWVNDPAVRRSAFESHPIAWEEHVTWFQRHWGSAHCEMYLVIDRDGRPVGQVRFDLQADGSAEVDVSIAPTQRRCGYGTQTLVLACVRLFATHPVQRIVAHIRPENLASIRTFEKVGFVHEGSEQVKGVEAVQLALLRPVPFVTRRAP